MCRSGTRAGARAGSWPSFPAGLARTSLLLRSGRARRFGARQEGAQVMRHGPGLFEGQGAAEGGHDGAAALDDDAGELAVAAAGLPARVGEVGHVGHVPDAATVDAVAADAVAVVEVGDHAFFLVRAALP